MRVSRRNIQVWLGLLWLLDGALQLQPFMFGSGFAHQVIAPAGDGQPAFVSAGVDWATHLITTQTTLWDSLFALVQLLIGLGLLIRPTVRPALVASIAWALSVWYLGEGLGGLASGHTDLLTGAPGAVLLYAVLAVAAWPGLSKHTPAPQMPAAWLPVAWAVLWIGGAVLRALPGQHTTTDVTGVIAGNADGAPAWLAHVDHTVATALHNYGLATIVVAILLPALIGIAGLVPSLLRQAAAAAGIVVAVFIWIVGQSLGELYTGQATDPNTAPLIILLALATASAPGHTSKQTTATVTAADPHRPLAAG